MKMGMVLGAVAALASAGTAQGGTVSIDDDYLNFADYSSLAVVGGQVFAGGDIYDAGNLAGGVIGTQVGSGLRGRALNEVNGNHYGTNGGSIFNFTTGSGAAAARLNNSSFAAFGLDLLEADLNGNFSVQNEITGDSWDYNNFFTTGVTAMTAEYIGGRMHLFYARDNSTDVFQAVLNGNLYDGTASLDLVETWTLTDSLVAGLGIGGIDISGSRLYIANSDGVGSGEIAIVPAPPAFLLTAFGLGLAGAARKRRG